MEYYSVIEKWNHEIQRQIQKELEKKHPEWDKTDSEKIQICNNVYMILAVKSTIVTLQSLKQ